MDSLAAYGSDSSVSDDQKAQEETKKPSASLNGLLGAYSDDDTDNDDDNGNVNAKKDDNVKELQKNLKPPPSKRPRTQDAPPPTTTAFSAFAPPPLGNDSIIHWTVDYLKATDKQLPPASTKLAEKLERLHANNAATGTSWAEHLKSQHEFHNPHFFDSVVEHFGIEQPLGSQVSQDMVQDFEFDIVGLPRPKLKTKEEQVPESTWKKRSFVFLVSCFTFGTPLTNEWSKKP